MAFYPAVLFIYIYLYFRGIEDEEEEILFTWCNCYVKSVPSADLLKKSVQNWFHSVSKEHHPVLHKVIPNLTFLEYYNKLKEGEHLSDTAAIYVLCLHMNKTIGVITSNGIWPTVKTTNIDECDMKFAY